MRILHTEASPGWGGQELRILTEAEGMRKRGHEVILAVQKGGGLVNPAREKGFLVYEISFQKTKILLIFFQLVRLVYRHRIEIINTHSSLDAWLGGFVGKIMKRKVIRTRHLSTPVRSGLNCRMLYNFLADYVVTTCEEAMQTIRLQAKLPQSRCLSIPTGVDAEQIHYDPKETLQFRAKLGLQKEDCLAGTLCVLRGWKGVSDLLGAAKLLENTPHLKWIVVGSGVSEEYFLQERKRLGLEEKVIFTGHLPIPFTALASLDIFLLLSFANEGVSQASLQAAWLEKPLITTPIGGLKEVCLDNQTGYLVPKNNPQAVAEAVLKLFNDKTLRMQMGKKAKNLVQERFTLEHTLQKMEEIYQL